jgi:hypothetical protein
MATSTLAIDDLPEDLELPNGGFSSAERRRAPEEVRGVERGKWATAERTKGSRGFYLAAVSSDHGGLKWTRLASVGGVLGLRCTLSPAVGWWLSVAKRSGRGGLGFRPGATETGLAWVGTIGQGARRGCRRVCSLVPCRCA